jgi:hypothetical protein
MDFAEICCNFSHAVGEFVGRSHNALSSAEKTVRTSREKLRTKLPEKIRSVVSEKLTRLLYKEAEFALSKLGERLQVITQASLALEEKIKQLAARGPVSEADLWKAMDSLEAAKSLTDDEKALLVNIFAQITKTQKTKFVDAVVVENPSPSSPQVLQEPRP